MFFCVCVFAWLADSMMGLGKISGRKTDYLINLALLEDRQMIILSNVRNKFNFA